MDITVFPRLNYNELQWGKKIGEGISGTVYRGSYDNLNYALKVYNSNDELWNNNKDEMVSSIVYELNTAKKCEGLKRVVQTKGVSYNEENGILTVVIIMELLESIGDLSDFLQQKMFWIPQRCENYMKRNKNSYGIYNYDEQVFWIFELNIVKKKKLTIMLIEALIELHGVNIIHGDLKTNNLVYHNSNYSEKAILKIIDLGVSFQLKENDNLPIDIDYYVGTEGYMAPEQHEHKLSFKSDIYSLGVIMVEMWNGEVWLDGNGFQECRNEVLKSLRNIENNNLPLGRLIRKCVSLNDTKRPPLKKLLNSMKQLFQV